MKLIALIVAAGKGERMAEACTPPAQRGESQSKGSAHSDVVGGKAVGAPPPNRAAFHLRSSAPPLKWGSMDRASGLPKQYQPIAGMPMIRHSAGMLAAHEAVSEVTCVIHPQHESHFAAAFDDAPTFVHGGETRQESVLNGLRAAKEKGASHVLIHDAARPALTSALISRLVAALDAHEAVIPCVPVADSLKEVKEDKVMRPVSRDALYQVQTPQAFELEHLLVLHEAAQRAGNVGYTDDAGLFEAAGEAVHVVAGERKNMKVTYQEDLDIVEAILECSSLRGA